MSAIVTAPPRRWADGLILFALLLIFWQGLYEYAGEVAITPPLFTASYAASLLGRASFWPHAAETGMAFALALVISAAAGVTTGLLLGLRRFAGDVAEPLLAAAYTIPKVTLYPVMLLIFGLGMSAKVAFGVIHGFVPVVLFTLGAVKSIPPVYLRAARTHRLGGAATARHVLIPAVLPEIVSGLRVGFSLTLLGVLIGEMFASQRGLGFLIISGISQHNVKLTMAVTLIVVAVAVAANTALLALDRRMHHGSTRGRTRI